MTAPASLRRAAPGDGQVPTADPDRLRFQRQYLRVQGRRVELDTVGTGEPLLFLHGFGANPSIYRNSLTRLAAHGRTVIAPALPSFGKSDPLPVSQQNVAGVAAHLAATLDVFNPDLGPVDVVGHSFGGGVSLKIAALEPGRVKSLTLICPVGGAGQGASGVTEVLRGILGGDAGHRWIYNGYRHFLPALLRHPSRVVATGLSAWFSDQIEDVETVDAHGIPVRFLFAKDDRLVRAGAIPQRVSGNVHVEVQEGKHSWLIGECDRFVDVVLGAPVVRLPRT